MTIEIIPSIFIGKNKVGDFNWMINQPEYDNALFIFNDNEEFHYMCIKGIGNAIIRQYNCYNKNISIPRSAGIPTGTMKNGGYTELSPDIKKIIKSAIREIKQLIDTYNYQTIYFSSDKNGKLGTSIFTVHPDVIDYITSKIKLLAK